MACWSTGCADTTAWIDSRYPSHSVQCKFKLPYTTRACDTLSRLEARYENEAARNFTTGRKLSVRARTFLGGHRARLSRLWLLCTCAPSSAGRRVLSPALSRSAIFLGEWLLLS